MNARRGLAVLSLIVLAVSLGAMDSGAAEHGSSTDAFAVYSARTGLRDPRFPRMVRDTNHNPEVLAVAADGSGGWFVGGEFGRSDGVDCANLAHLGRDGTLDSHFCPAPNGRVVALLVHQGVLYVGGAFTRFGSLERRYLAAIDAATGRLRQWNANISGKVYYDRTSPIQRGVWALAARAGILYAAGRFDTVGETPRRGVAAIRTKDGRPTAWAPVRPRPDLAPRFIALTARSLVVDSAATAFDLTTAARLWSLPPETIVEAIVPDGPTLIVARDLVRAGSGYRYGTAVEQYRAETGLRIRRVTSTAGEIVALAVAGPRLYVGGVFSGLDRMPRRSLAAFDSRSIHLLPWAPAGALSGYGVTLAIAATPATVAVGVGTCRPTC